VSWSTGSDHYEPLKGVAESSGLRIDELNYVACLLLAYPLGLLFRFIPHSQETVRHLFGTVIGLGFGYFCFRE
jgi:hypothetical protein